ncbi:MAG: DNA recombination protein RmuC, partial [Deferribacterales bacterium]|nr:DNA recombination protein RmuC [Deferribacterales bacterium]
KNLSELNSGQIRILIDNQRNGFNDFNNKLAEDLKKGEERGLFLQDIVKDSLKEIKDSQDKFTETVALMIKELTNTLKAELTASKDDLNKSLKSFEEVVDNNLEKVRKTLEDMLDKLRVDNEKKLEEMRKTVDEKLHETLEIRLANSFKVVSERLEQVHKGLGEMQTLANGVGDLKKALTNVKSRGIIGEIQLRRVLEQILHPGQYEENVKTKPNSNDVVEFAVKLPGNDGEAPVLLPIDSKFPVEDYYRLLDSVEKGDLSQIQESTKQLENRVRQSAKDISTKYIEVPFTTDFAILFLPFEGLYSEVLRINGLFESIQRDYKVVITGPTTMAAFLNSLQMGFKTLSVEKSAHKVMNLLAVVKSEFTKFGAVLEKAQKKIKEAGDNIDDLVGVRTRKIQKALEGVEVDSAKEIDDIV